MDPATPSCAPRSPPASPRRSATLPPVSPTWIWMQAGIVVCVLAGIVIAIVKLA